MTTSCRYFQIILECGSKEPKSIDQVTAVCSSDLACCYSGPKAYGETRIGRENSKVSKLMKISKQNTIKTITIGIWGSNFNFSRKLDNVRADIKTKQSNKGEN